MGMMNNIVYFSIGYYIGKNYSRNIQDFIEKNYDQETMKCVIQKILGNLEKEN